MGDAADKQAAAVAKAAEKFAALRTSEARKAALYRALPAERLLRFWRADGCPQA